MGKLQMSREQFVHAMREQNAMGRTAGVLLASSFYGAVVIVSYAAYRFFW